MSSDQTPNLLSPYRTASVLIRSLHAQGVRHAVVSPGSRSTPLTLALAHHSGFEKHVVLDERSAAFIALGIGKATGLPAILVCTSGTAAANYFPAVVEAKQSGVPIIILTADRPPELRGIGSSQTIDQLNLYGHHAIFFHELGEPADTSRDIKRIQFAAKQCVVESVRRGGTAHINIPFRKPLEPAQSDIKEEALAVSESIAEPDAVSERTITLSKSIRKLLELAKRPLIIAGPANPSHNLSRQAVTLAEHLGAPVIAEPGSGFGAHEQRIHRYEQFLRSSNTAGSLKPELILRFGDQPFTKSILTILESWSDLPLIRFDSRNSWQDHTMSSSFVVELKPDDILKTGRIPKKNPGYLKRWQEAESEADTKLKTALSKSTSLTDGHIFRHLSDQLTEGWQIMISNSLPVRDSALFGEPHQHSFVNRGAAGIDGIVSTALGTALATKRPTCCIVGDLAMLHDTNALLSLKLLDSPFTIVVVNNNGGNIFRMLPIYEEKETYTPYFETPQNPDFKSISASCGAEYSRIETLEELKSLTFDTAQKPGLVECVTSPDESMKMRRELWSE